MKTNIQKFVILTIFLAYFSSQHSALAYYDPGLQRWLNRDPVAEYGGINLFGCCNNDLLDRLDVFGLDIAGYGWGTGDHNDPPPIATAPGRICGWINGKPVWCLPKGPTPRCPAPKPQPPTSSGGSGPDDDDPKHCWKAPDPLLKGTEAWSAAVTMAEEQCNACCARDYFKDPGIKWQACTANCAAAASAALMGGGAAPIAPTPPPNVKPIDPPRPNLPPRPKPQPR